MDLQTIFHQMILKTLHWLLNLWWLIFQNRKLSIKNVS